MDTAPLFPILSQKLSPSTFQPMPEDWFPGLECCDEHEPKSAFEKLLELSYLNVMW